MPQRYERVAANDDEDSSINSSQQPYPIPSSPPPSFRSHDSSPTSPTVRQRLLAEDPLERDADRTLADTFDSPSDEEDDDEKDDGRDDRQRLMRANPDEIARSQHSEEIRPGVQRTVTQLPAFAPAPPTGRVYGGGMNSNDGVFANMSAKPQRGDDHDEKPPTYEQAAADATPPYWETTILAPGMLTDEVYVDGLPVGSFPSLFWNFIITFGFPVVGFLLTYLLHTTHAAKRGSFAGLGALMIQYGFTMKGAADLPGADPTQPGAGNNNGDFNPGAPSDPNSHDFNPDDATAPQGGEGMSMGVSGEDWLAYAFMIVGWFILIKSLSDYLKARKHEQLVLASPERTGATEENHAASAV